MKKILKWSVGALLVLIVVALAGIQWIENKHEEGLSQVTLSEINLAEMDNGTYNGSYKVFPVAVEVNVTVKDHKITAVELVEHRNGQGGPAEAIVDRVIEAQTLHVDTITGATSSSRVILKAIDNALTKASRGSGSPSS